MDLIVFSLKTPTDIKIYNDHVKKVFSLDLNMLYIYDILPGIIMEVDLPSNHPDGKLPILDMKCYVKNDLILYEHYEKKVSSKLVISARSAHSAQTKRSVHISELVRRMMNTSPLLDWSEHCAPVLTDYLKRMMAAGYNERYRKDILCQAVNIYDSKVRKDADGSVPLNRPNGFRKLERRQEKIQSRRTWSTQGGYTAPIIVQSTPGGVLAKLMREVAEKESTPDIKFKVIERGGTTLIRQLQRANPTAPPKCSKTDCGICSQEDSYLRCHLCNICYRYTCNYPDCQASYVGESSKNMYTRHLGHVYKYEKKDGSSWMQNHQVQAHEGAPADFAIKILSSHKDALSRQTAESVRIALAQDELGEEYVMNSKSEFHQPSITRLQTRIRHGL